MLLSGLDRRLASAIRIAGLAVLAWSVAHADHPPGTSGRDLVVTISFAASVVSWLVWTARPDEGRSSVTPDLYGLAAGGGVLLGASPNSAASVFVFVAIIAATIRVGAVGALPVLATGALSLSISVLAYGGGGLGLLAYFLGFLVAMLMASSRRDSRDRAEQAELLLAQTQRTHEEQLRAARLQESTRIAREIHDVLAHTLAGLTIQLEATASLVEQDAGRDTILARVRRAHGLAREGLEETRRAVGALRASPVAPRERIEALVADYGATAGAPTELMIEGDPGRLSGAVGEAALRVVQEALTNVRKHAPGADVSVLIAAGSVAGEDFVVRIEDRVADGAKAPAPHGLSASGGGYGLQGMRERAQLLGGTLSAGATDGGWRVELHLPSPEGAAIPVQDAP